MDNTYLTITEVMKLLKLGKSSIYRRVKDGTLPKPVKIGNLVRFEKVKLEIALKCLASQTEEVQNDLHK